MLGGVKFVTVLGLALTFFTSVTIMTNYGIGLPLVVRLCRTVVCHTMWSKVRGEAF
jgi:hypothetical protein